MCMFGNVICHAWTKYGIWELNWYKNPGGKFTTHSDLAHFMLLKYNGDFTSKYFNIFISGGVKVVYIKNNRPKGHIAHLRNHFNQERYDYTTVLIKRKKSFPF